MLIKNIHEKNVTWFKVVVVLLVASSFVVLSILKISALCLCCCWAWWEVLVPVKLCLFELFLLTTIGGDNAGLLGLLGEVLELLELGLVIMGEDVVVELSPEETFELESGTGNFGA